MSAHREIICAWSEWENMLRFLTGDTLAYGTTGKAKFPGISFLRVSRIRIKPIHNDQRVQVLSNINEDLAAYDSYAQFSLDYAPLPTYERPISEITIEPETFLTYHMDYGAEYQQLTGTTLEWEDDASLPVREEAMSTVRISIVEHHLTLHRVVDPPWDTIALQAGCVNDGLFLDAPAETVIFDGCRTGRDFTNIDLLGEAEIGHRLEYVFREKRIKVFGDGNTYGWNHLWRDGGWHRLLNSNNQPQHSTAHFGNLFRSASSQLGE